MKLYLLTARTIDSATFACRVLRRSLPVHKKVRKRSKKDAYPLKIHREFIGPCFYRGCAGVSVCAGIRPKAVPEGGGVIAAASFRRLGLCSVGV